ncbi:MAG: GH3 auxin-responsive promoter family protein, partial [Bacteroidota bacterium]
DKALNIACEKTGASIEEYTAGPVFMGEDAQGGHEWLIEFSTPPQSMEYFSDVLDNALKAQNSDYEAKRYKNMALRPPVVRTMPRGTFYTWMKSRGKLGGQNKIPRLANTRQYIDSVLDSLARNFQESGS